MTFKSLALPLITCLSLLAFSYLSSLLSHSGTGFILLALSIFTFSIVSLIKPSGETHTPMSASSCQLKEAK
ncbi:hypothetical protein [Pseudoalteromonas luteoviolacea]|uniref:Uncharacterized protein n=1 Tax=Pseudoalteromonas luteoviolacea S4054 TaxID=1129367 RepID=A0A0F6A9F4_9GAMM|nr:hypothetical protein [Pseudoalteromonas luteoviolacea]AOT06887.1 hypothetical protein S4054249_02900 [Pseudoalteromonas luteoviolacea]AOT11805.1 hypothetical protein S40542_02900 [Pseudoalteromonas luteoviolacea]AOT16717.1 hypothetical protein S4054_02900 [Pseudoalteromonas luteoviolacea]KKE82788.1 hypothetical protein N479_17175 [Pseudoalteromonas luteoviolacea S4054]KZN72999.1 hypothetical protein N481_14180 [Pseudoalteromonas luteoviolacea S4047-1]